MMPYSVARSEFGALFFAKTKARLGVFPRDIDDVTWRRLQTNAGVSVFVVAEGTPAFAADVLPGDIILAIGDDSIQSVGHFFKLLDKYQSQRPLFKIDRAGKSLEKQIEIQPYNTKAPISYKKIKQDANADYRSLQH
jgi:C-terminal processing protease CtpA/Prc